MFTWRGWKKNSNWTLSVKFLNAKPGDSAVKAISISAFSKWLLHPPKPSPSLSSTEPQEMNPAQKGCAEKWTCVNLGHIVPMRHAKQTYHWRWLCCMSIRTCSVCTHGRNIGLLYGMTGLSILQPWPQMKRGRPGPLCASEGPAACCRLSLDHCLSCCWSLWSFWLG